VRVKDPTACNYLFQVITFFRERRKEGVNRRVRRRRQGEEEGYL
jgi:hypothetical protein